jgi:hypothetical protein
MRINRNAWRALVYVCVAIYQSVAPTNSSPVVPFIARSPQHRARHAHPLNPVGNISWSVVCTIPL